MKSGRGSQYKETRKIYQRMNRSICRVQGDVLSGFSTRHQLELAEEDGCDVFYLLNFFPVLWVMLTGRSSIKGC